MRSAADVVTRVDLNAGLVQLPSSLGFASVAFPSSAATVEAASTAWACLDLRHSFDQAVLTPSVEPMCSDSSIEEVAVVEKV